jgi:hypothetical protein
MVGCAVTVGWVGTIGPSVAAFVLGAAAAAFVVTIPGTTADVNTTCVRFSATGVPTAP